MIKVNLGERSYDITIERGAIGSVGRIFNLDRRVLVLTDSGVPKEYAEAVAKQAKEARIVTVDEGEGAKSLEVMAQLLGEMSDFRMSRGDALVAVGGGVVGDLGGFTASIYMRGIDFYNVPTTLLSEVDSSIGGKTAVNLGGVKNIVGAFYQPKGVVIDPDCLETLDYRQISSGLAEVVKMSLTSDKALFEYLEEKSLNEIIENIDYVIEAALKIKKDVVEKDEREGGLRKILNFGHSFGHGIEAEEEMKGLYHGECVALGMLPVSSESVRKRLIPVLKKLGLPTEYTGDIDSAFAFVSHDKKASDDGISIVFVDEIGSFRIEKISFEEFYNKVRAVF